MLCQWVALQDKPSFSAMEGTSLLVQKASPTQPELDRNRVVQHLAPNTNAAVGPSAVYGPVCPTGLLPLLYRKGTQLLKSLLKTFWHLTNLLHYPGRKLSPDNNRPILSALKSRFHLGQY